MKAFAYLVIFAIIFAPVLQQEDLLQVKPNRLRITDLNKINIDKLIVKDPDLIDVKKSDKINTDLTFKDPKIRSKNFELVDDQNYILRKDLNKKIPITDLVITKDLTQKYTLKESWKPVTYENNVFKGWTVDEVKSLMLTKIDMDFSALAKFDVITSLLDSIDWSTHKCSHAVRNQGTKCGSCWAFAIAGMMSDRCCFQGTDYGWLAPQELVSCADTEKGCDGGWPARAVDHIKDNKGLVHEACYPYAGVKSDCPTTCQDGKDWTNSHICSCTGEFKRCNSEEELKSCLHTGPVVVTFGVCNSFLSYGSGVYKCDCEKKDYLSLHAVLAMGYSNDPSCNYLIKNSWGEDWGDKGYFRIGCGECHITGEYNDGNVVCTKAGGPKFIGKFKHLNKDILDLLIKQNN